MRNLTNLKEIEDKTNEKEEIIISKNRREKCAVMSMKEYREKSKKKDIESHLLKAEDDIRNGRVKDAREVFKNWKEKYGI